MANSVTPEKKSRKKYGKFAVQKFKNPSGQCRWRVSGTINGRRIRRNFENKDDAIAEKQRLDLQQKAEEGYEKVVVTSLSREQCEEAKVAFKLLEGRKKPLSFYVRYALDRYREAEFELTLEEAIDKYVLQKRIECERNLITAVQFRILSAELNRFKSDRGDKLLGEVDAAFIRDWLDSHQVGESRRHISPKTFNNKRSYLNTFFRYCVNKDWLMLNPVDKVPQLPIKAKRGSAATISAERAAELMAYLEEYNAAKHPKGFLVPYFALCLFAGLRPDIRTGEMGRLASKDIRIDTGVILIEPDVSKVDEKRSIKIQPNLRLWLDKYPVDQYPIIPRYLEGYTSKIRAKFGLGHNVLRHTYISMTVGAFKSVGDASLQAGNSESIIRKHYLNLKTEAEADSFWRVIPEGATLPTNLVKLEGRFEETKPLESGKEKSA